MKFNAVKLLGIAAVLASVVVTASCAKQGLSKPIIALTSAVNRITTSNRSVAEITEFSAPAVLEPIAVSESSQAVTDAETTQVTKATTAVAYTTRYTAEQRKEFFEDAVFIGDSRVEDFVLFNGFPSENCYASSGISVSTFYTKECIEINGKKYSPFEALRMRKKLGRVYVGFGLNEIDWPYQDVFIKDYAKVLADIRSIDPKAEIYVISILPVTQNNEEHGKATNAKIVESNKHIRQMALDNEAVYADAYSYIADRDGCLPAFAAADGVHMGRKLNIQWAEYLYSLG